MPYSHRSLNITKFYDAVGSTPLTDYFIRLGIEEQQAAQMAFNISAFNHFMEDPAHADLSDAINETFNRINDVCATSHGILRRAFEVAWLVYNVVETPEAQGMQLYLDYPDLFDRAYSRYLLVAGDARMSVYSIPIPDFAPTEQHESGFRSDVEAWFKQVHQDTPKVLVYPEYDEWVIRIKHSSNLQHFLFREEDGSETSVQGRLAQEDC